MDAVADLGAENVIYEAVLSDTAQAGKRRGGDDGIEVVPVPRHLGSSPRDPRLDPLLQFLGRSRHFAKRSALQPTAILAEA